MNELEFRIKELIRLTELATNGNIFAKHECTFKETGLAVDINAILPKKCDHIKESPNGRRYKTQSWIEAKNRLGFEIHERICTQCGKTVETAIEKAKQA